MNLPPRYELLGGQGRTCMKRRRANQMTIPRRKPNQPPSPKPSTEVTAKLATWSGRRGLTYQ